MGNFNNVKTVTYHMEYYDTLAAGYDELHGEEQRRKHTILEEHLLVEEDELLLDVGCGTGISSEFFDCRVIGIDDSREMLMEARRQSTGNADYILATGEQMPFKSHVFDTIICVTTIHNFTSPRAALNEIRRVSKKRGAITVLKKAKEAQKLERHVDEMLGETDVVDENFDRIFFFNIHENHQ